MKQWVGLLDCNNFFVSCERLFRPELRSKPVIVLSSNDGCVVARSQEIKDIGIPMGVPYFKVKDILKTNNTEIFSGNLELYRDISKRVFAAMRSELDVIQEYSIDEAFFLFEAENPEEVAKRVKDKVERMVGIPVSVGVASSKTIAKIANDQAKKTTGTAVLDDKTWKEKRPSVLVGEVWGIGGKLEKRLHDIGIKTVEDLIETEDRQMKAWFGVVGLRLKRELLGESVLGFSSIKEAQKSLMSTKSLASETTDKAVLYDAVAYHVNHIGLKLRAANLKTKTIRIALLPSRYSDFILQSASAERVFEMPTNDTQKLLREATELLRKIYKQQVPYKKVGVYASFLQEASVTQQSLFEDGSSDDSVLQSAIDAINKRLGKGKLQVGRVESSNRWRPKSELRSPSYTTKWKDIPSVKA